jgi:caffeoyl-CoA O-methyltransferase
VSAEATLVTQRHFDYVARHAPQEDRLLRDLREAARAAGIPPIHIQAAQGAFLQILVRASAAREVVEVGTLAGYSAIWLARGLPKSGRLRTIEALESHARFAREWIARSDVADRVEVILGRGQDVLPAIADASVDLVFLDADKAGYAGYLREALRMLREGGLLCVDNAFAFGQLFDERPADREAPAIQAFNEVMAKEPGLVSVIVPLGDGCWVGVKSSNRRQPPL